MQWTRGGFCEEISTTTAKEVQRYYKLPKGCYRISAYRLNWFHHGYQVAHVEVNDTNGKALYTLDTGRRNSAQFHVDSDSADVGVTIRHRYHACGSAAGLVQLSCSEINGGQLNPVEVSNSADVPPKLKRLPKKSMVVKTMDHVFEESSEIAAAMEEYRDMAEALVEEFKAHAGTTQAESLFEQAFVEAVLKGTIFVGHEKTDLDSIAGAIGGATLYGGHAVRAERELNGEIKIALQFAGLAEPAYFDDFPGAAKPDKNGELLKVCLVDHNEEKQMVESLRNDKNRSKRIVGLIDHHAMAESFNSEKPLFVDVRPWGSMSSIVAHQFLRGNHKISVAIARILMSAILSDTLNLRSVTTTNADRMMVSILANMGEVEDPDAIAAQMFRAKTEWIVNLGAYEMTRGDQKDFEILGWKFGISVLEVTDPGVVLERADDLLLEIRILKVEKGREADGSHNMRRELDFAYLFVVDVTKQRSVMLISGGRELELAKVAFPDGKLRAARKGVKAPGETISSDETMMDVGGMVSRKAEFAPAFLKALKEGFTYKKGKVSEMSDDELKAEAQDDAHAAMRQMASNSEQTNNGVKRDYAKVRKSMKVAGPIKGLRT